MSELKRPSADDVLRRMLSTPHSDHAPKAKKAKAKKRPKKK